MTDPNQLPEDDQEVTEHDPEVAEEYAESVPIDPAPDEVNRYLQLVGDPAAEPDDEAGATGPP